jgi:uncharacterized protein (TIRG00374 family)
MLNLSYGQKRALALSLVVAATLYLVFILLTGYEAILTAVLRLGWSGWLLLLTCSLTNYLLRFLRWQYYLQALGHRLPISLNFLYYMSGFALTTTPGKAGETIRSVYLNSHGVTYSDSLAMFFTERFLDVVVVTLLAALSVLSFNEYGQFILTAAGALLLFLPLLRSRYLVAWLQALTLRISYARLRHLVLQLSNLLDSARSLLQWRRLYGGLGIGLLAWIVQGLAFYYILINLQVELPLYIAIAIYAISLLAGALSFVPGGIGTTEAVMGLLLLNNGSDEVTAVAVPLISRLSTLWFAVVLGLLASLRLSMHPRTETPVSSKP